MGAAEEKTGTTRENGSGSVGGSGGGGGGGGVDGAAGAGGQQALEITYTRRSKSGQTADVDKLSDVNDDVESRYVRGVLVCWDVRVVRVRRADSFIRSREHAA